MKNLLFWIFLICGTFIFIGSCAKKEEEAASTTSCATDTTASGSITVGSETMSGVYLSPCWTGFADIAGQQIFPSDVKSGNTVVVVTGNTAISEEILMYTDTACSTPSMTWKKGRTEFTVGSASGSNYAVTYKEATVKVKVSTDVAKSHMDTFAQSVGLSETFTKGTEKTITDDQGTKHNLFLVTSTTVRHAEAASSTPSALDSMVMTKACQ